MENNNSETLIVPLTCKNILSGYYKIDEYGTIYNNKNQILKPKEDKNGYLIIGLCVNEFKNGNEHARKMFRISQLVIRTFIGDPPLNIKDPTVDHIDGNIYNNHYKNLRWLERGENSSIRHSKPIGIKNGAAILNEIQVIEICEMLMNTKLSFSEIAKIFKTNKSTISNIKRKKNWKYIADNYDFSHRDRFGSTSKY